MEKKSQTSSNQENKDFNSNNSNIQSLAVCITNPNAAKVRGNEVLNEVDGQLIKISEATFENEGVLTVKLDGIKYIYYRTKVYKDTVYFQCSNRQKGELTGKKCLAKAHYDRKTRGVVIINLHNPKCQASEEPRVAATSDFNSQKSDLLENLQKDAKLTVVGGLGLLRNKNEKASPSSKKQPLNYFQVKKIIQDFRHENHINSKFSFDEPGLLKTIDNSIFRRVHNHYDLIYKSNLIFTLIKYIR